MQARNIITDAPGSQRSTLRLLQVAGKQSKTILRERFKFCQGGRILILLRKKSKVSKFYIYTVLFIDVIIIVRTRPPLYFGNFPEKIGHSSRGVEPIWLEKQDVRTSSGSTMGLMRA